MSVVLRCNLCGSVGGGVGWLKVEPASDIFITYDSETPPFHFDEVRCLRAWADLHVQGGGTKAPARDRPPELSRNILMALELAEQELTSLDPPGTWETTVDKIRAVIAEIRGYARDEMDGRP
jgi:hypothetical protein